MKNTNIVYQNWIKDTSNTLLEPTPPTINELNLTYSKINDYKIYRIFPSGEIQYLHPTDGVFPEKVNPGRTTVNSRNFSIGKNPNPASVKFTGISTYNS